MSSCINFQFKALLYLAESTDDKFHCIETCVYDIIRNLTKIDLPKRPEPEICQGLNENDKCKYAEGLRKCLPPNLDERFWKDVFTRI